ncbi:MAG TPA: hypothetical protein VF015_08015 [Acidimicrobiales bacterium]
MTRSTAETKARPARPRRAAYVGTAVAAVVLLVAAGCGDDDDSTTAGAAGGGNGPTIDITAPAGGAEVGRSFDVEIDSSESLGEPDTGRHHVHLYYDGNTQEGEYDVVYGDSATVDGLDPGEHTVEAVIANADHSLTDARDEITVTVSDDAGAGGGTTDSSDETDDDGTDYGY